MVVLGVAPRVLRPRLPIDRKNQRYGPKLCVFLWALGAWPLIASAVGALGRVGLAQAGPGANALVPGFV